jgi:hypothetical protein
LFDDIPDDGSEQELNVFMGSLEGAYDFTNHPTTAARRISDGSMSIGPQVAEEPEDDVQHTASDKNTQQSLLIKGAIHSHQKRRSTWQRVSGSLFGVEEEDSQEMISDEDLNALNRLDDQLTKSKRFSEWTHYLKTTASEDGDGDDDDDDELGF